MSDEVVSLREFFERIIAERDKALALQQNEYARRLDELNHAHERSIEVAHTYLTIDKYETGRDSDASALSLALQRVDEKIDSLENFRSRATGVAAVVVLFAGLVGAAVARALGS